MMISRHFPRPRCRAFSLPELLIVMSLIAVLIALVTNSMRSLGASRDIGNSAALLTNLALQAQQTATSKNAMTMLVVAPDANGSLTLVTLLEHPLGASQWTQMSRWDRFADGIFIHREESTLPLPTLKHSPFPLRHSGREIEAADTVYQVFLPGGSLLGQQSVAYKVAAISDPRGENPCTVRINAATGACTVERP